jgi:hypothetical protein
MSNGEIENNLLGFINQIKELLNTKKIDNSTTLAKDIENNENFLFKPLEDIPAEKEKKEVKRNGFIVYSRETIKSHLINGSETLEQRFKCIYEKCKNYEKINESENYIYRYYYYRELEYKNKKRPLKELATIIMINPAFASS